MSEQIALNPAQQKFLAQTRNSFKFNLFLLAKLPSAYFCGVRLREIDEQKCTVSVPYKWLSQNPFRSTYFACLAMAAEMSTGLPALMAITGSKPPVSMLVVNLQAEFVKKADKRTVFTFDDVQGIMRVIEEAKETGEGMTYEATSIGRLPDGEEVARFKVVWSFKARAK